MKKIISTLLLLALVYIGQQKTYDAMEHTQFEKLEVIGGKMLSEYTKKEYSTYYKKVSKRKFYGWRTHKVHKNLKANFIGETLFSYYNDGYTPIEYEYTLEEKESSKYSVSSSGSIGLKVSGTFKGFKGGLDGQLKIDTKKEHQSETKTKTELSFLVDPGTQVDLYIYGEGKLTNGVAALYVFWFTSQKGGFEYFEITTQYQRLEKKRI